MKRILMLGVLGFGSLHAAASNEIEDKQLVLKIMKQYSEVTACASTFTKDADNGKQTTIHDITTVEYNKSDNSYVFYVLWGGDLGCQGGSGTLSSYVTEVAKYGGNWKPYTIKTDYAFGQDTDLDYRYIESVKKISPFEFEVISWANADSKYGGVDGGSNFPANKFRYTLKRERFEPWKVTHQALLEQRK